MVDARIGLVIGLLSSLIGLFWHWQSLKDEDLKSSVLNVVEARIGLDTFQQHLDMIAKSDAMLAAKRREPALAVGKVLKKIKETKIYKSKPKRREPALAVAKVFWKRG